MADRLTDEGTKHWTGKSQSMTAMVRIDGKPFRLMGAEGRRAPALEQTSLEVTPTRTVYSFRGAGIEATLAFLSPLLIDDLDILARPVTYITADVRSADGADARRGPVFRRLGRARRQRAGPESDLVPGGRGGPDRAVLRIAAISPSSSAKETTSASTGASSTWPRRTSPA